MNIIFLITIFFITLQIMVKPYRWLWNLLSMKLYNYDTPLSQSDEYHDAAGSHDTNKYFTYSIITARIINFFCDICSINVACIIERVKCNIAVATLTTTGDQLALASAKNQSYHGSHDVNNSDSNSSINTMSQDGPNFASSLSDTQMDNPMRNPLGLTSTTRTSHTDDDQADKILETNTRMPPRRRWDRFETPHSRLLILDQIIYSLITSKEHIRIHHTTQEIDNNSEPAASQGPSGYSDCPRYINTGKPLRRRWDLCETSSAKSLILDQIRYSLITSKEVQSNNSETATLQGGSLRKDMFSPTKIDECRNLLNEYPDSPRYIGYTESTRAKQRPRFDGESSTKNDSVHNVDTLACKRFKGSGRLERLGMPVTNSTEVY